MAVVLVTGCAGFVGARLTSACLVRGDKVIGVDSLTEYYDIGQKRANLARLREHGLDDFRSADLVDLDHQLLDGIDVVFHLAGQPGVRDSWREQFEGYVRANVLATQRLLDASAAAGVSRFVYASSSSVYGNADAYPVDEATLPQPYSPYGVTKLAAEQMCSLYAENFGLSVASLRYFTVYGPGQRPDMAIHRLIRSALTGEPFPLFGSGEQIRDFTYVDDVVQANLLAGDADIKPGFITNIAGGGQCSMNQLIELVGDVVGQPVNVERQESEHGDVARTGASIEQARRTLGWTPTVDLRAGIERQVEWQRSLVA